MGAIVSKNKLITTYQFDFGEVKIYPSFAIGIMNDGIDLDLEILSELTTIVEKHYRNKYYGYISLRKNSYSVNPILYTYIKKSTNLKSIAIVSEKDIFKYNFKIEQYFFSKKMQLFKSLDEAVTWTLKNVS
ncbi:STAS/SEC14 domain-containing protein [Galbibacter sp. EGI 63066]|uniref:STAS/SEC14 domain-containing protein n=1 Tax=Galbibacter sp. EGI 63066 TaxID=2993559 RepID=UPI002249461B|nr:STAS/SEC14 domain-containing protein [Galbibacter sp. EGI 63066]MCX2680872.1 STAS/SEC14 domain-containing protein [Galbibacter sp. EGI 63066]